MKPLKNSLRHVWEKLDETLPNLDRDAQVAIIREMRANAEADIHFYVLILLSSAIAYLGLRQDSSAVVIGAMLVAPLMSPMMAIGFGIVKGHRRTFQRAALSTLGGIGLAVATAALLSFLIPSKIPTNEILARTQPNLLDLLVALSSGAAGAYALCNKKVAASLPGVAIAVALVPPLCVVGYGIGTAHWSLAQGALLLFATNLASIILAGIAIFWLLGFRPILEDDLPDFRRSVGWAVLGVLALLLPLGYVSVTQARAAQRRAAVEAVLTDDLDPTVIELQDITVEPSTAGYQVGFTAYVYEEFAPTDVAEIRRRLEQAVGGPVLLRARLVPAQLGVLKPLASRSGED